MPVARPRPPINCSKALLVEGSDEVNYLSELLKYLVLDPTTDVQPIEVGGKYNFRNEFPAFLKDSKFPQVTAYAIMRDADDSFELTLKSIQGLLNDNSQPCPRKHGEFASDGHRKVGIFIMPGYSNGRMLEDLCLQTVKDTSVMLHVEKFMAGLKEDKDIIYPKEESKAKLRVFLSVMPEIANSIGIAAQKGYLEFGHEMLTDLCNFLKELAK